MKPYIDRSKNIWVVRCNNFRLYNLFEQVRFNLSYLEKMLEQADKRASLLLIEGFFGAEGCVKIIKEEVRKTPKICLDITNTNFDILEVIRRLLKDCLDIEARYSIQKPSLGKDGSKRKSVSLKNLQKRIREEIF